MCDQVTPSENSYCYPLDPGTVVSTKHAKADKTSRIPTRGGYILVEEMDNT